MQTVSIGKLKKSVESLLEDVKRGEEVLIQDQNRTIAKIVPMNGDDDDYQTEEDELIAAGILRPPEIKELPDTFWDDLDETGLADISLETVVKVITDEREED